MTLQQLPVAGAPKKPHSPLVKVAIEEHFMNADALAPNQCFDPAAFARVSGLEPGFVDAVMKRMNDIHDKRIEEMDAAGIDISILSLTAAELPMSPEQLRRRARLMIHWRNMCCVVEADFLALPAYRCGIF